LTVTEEEVADLRDLGAQGHGPSIRHLLLIERPSVSPRRIWRRGGRCGFHGVGAVARPIWRSGTDLIERPFARPRRIWRRGGRCGRRGVAADLAQGRGPSIREHLWARRIAGAYGKEAR
jgi:hypothetical protein